MFKVGFPCYFCLARRMPTSCSILACSNSMATLGTHWHHHRESVTADHAPRWCANCSGLPILWWDVKTSVAFNSKWKTALPVLHHLCMNLLLIIAFSHSTQVDWALQTSLLKAMDWQVPMRVLWWYFQLYDYHLGTLASVIQMWTHVLA